MLKLTLEAWRTIASEASRIYPAECCGLLLGREEDSHRIIERALPTPNTYQPPSPDRFSIAPGEFLEAERLAESGGMALLGIYHSHPDTAARPSRFDAEGGWPWFSYLIVAVSEGRPVEAGSFRLDDSRMQYNPEPLEWLDERGQHVDPNLDSDAAALLRRPTGERGSPGP